MGILGIGVMDALRLSILRSLLGGAGIPMSPLLRPSSTNSAPKKSILNLIYAYSAFNGGFFG